MYNKVKESLIKFMDAWKIEDWIVMYKYIQMSWQLNQADLCRCGCQSRLSHRRHKKDGEEGSQNSYGM
jgi:hypothetical protein